MISETEIRQLLLFIFNDEWNFVEADQNGPTPKLPYGTYGINSTGGNMYASNVTLVDSEGLREVEANRIGTAEVNFYGAGAFAAADKLKRYLQLETVVDFATTVGINLSTVDEVKDLSATVNMQVKKRAMLEFDFMFVSVTQENAGLIETVEITRTVEGVFTHTGIVSIVKPT